MIVNLQLIQLVKQPESKNNWLAVDDYPQLEGRFPSLIQDYDFVDFEGRIFYYNILSQYKLEVNTGYMKHFKTHQVIVTKEKLIELLEKVMVFNKQVILNRFIDKEPVALLKF